MEKTTNIFVEYIASDSITMQGKRDKVEPYLKKGYYVKEERNGYWVLLKSAKVLVTLTNSYGTVTFDMKKDILDYYRRKRISMPLLETFQHDIKDGKIIIKMDENCQYYTIN